MARQVSVAQFNVLMGEFHDAINVVSTQSNNVHESVTGIEQNLNSVTDLWSSPAALTFEPLRVEFRRSADDLDDVLKGILHRMRITYANYLDAERKAQQNLTATSSGGHHGSLSGVQGHNVTATIPRVHTTSHGGSQNGDPDQHNASPDHKSASSAKHQVASESAQQPLPAEGHPVLPLGREAAPLKPRIPAIDANES